MEQQLVLDAVQVHTDGHECSNSSRVVVEIVVVVVAVVLAAVGVMFKTTEQFELFCEQ